MQIHLKVLFVTLVLVSCSYCNKYEDSSDENFDLENITASTVDYTDATFSSETMTSDTVNIENKSYTRKGLFDQETVFFEKKTDMPTTDETERTFSETTRTWVKETTEYNENATKHSDQIKEFCPMYKVAGNFRYNDMADVWQVAYYQASEKVQCFKIHVKMVSDEEKKALSKKFGSFSGKVLWKKCNLEIRSSAHMLRFHYLQGDNEDDGVMDNVIIRAESSEEKGDNDFRPSLHQEGPDQWMVYRNLLLMRDCETSNTVVFSRVPHEPTFGDILDALKEFGEEDKNGRLACNDEEIIKPFDTDEEGPTNFD